MFLASYTFNSQYRPHDRVDGSLPSLRLLEGGRFLPQDYSPVLVSSYGQTRLRFFKWGFVHAWARGVEAKAGKAFADVDQLFDYTPFQLALDERRCLIPADGFYRACSSGKDASLMKLDRKDGEMFCFAGIFAKRKTAQGQEEHSFAMLSAEAPASMQSLGLRMPLIIPKSQEQAWLNPHTSLRKLRTLFEIQEVENLQWMPVLELQELEEQELVAA